MSTLARTGVTFSDSLDVPFSPSVMVGRSRLPGGFQVPLQSAITLRADGCGDTDQFKISFFHGCSSSLTG